MLLRIEYELFYSDPGGRQHSRQNLGDLGVLEASAAGVLTESSVARMNGAGYSTTREEPSGCTHTVEVRLGDRTSCGALLSEF